MHNFCNPMNPHLAERGEQRALVFVSTETGWPMLAIQRGIEVMSHKFGSSGVPVYGYNMNR